MMATHPNTLLHALLNPRAMQHTLSRRRALVRLLFRAPTDAQQLALHVMSPCPPPRFPRGTRPSWSPQRRCHHSPPLPMPTAPSLPADTDLEHPHVQKPHGHPAACLAALTPSLLDQPSHDSARLPQSTAMNAHRIEGDKVDHDQPGQVCKEAAPQHASRPTAWCT